MKQILLIVICVCAAVSTRIHQWRQSCYASKEMNRHFFFLLVVLVLVAIPAQAQVVSLPRLIRVEADAPTAQKSYEAPSRDCLPILFVHGLASDDRTWQTTLDVLRDQFRLGDYVTIHFVLNASLGSTNLSDDVVIVEPNIPSEACLFAVNFQNWWNGSDTAFLYGHHSVIGESESNQSAIVKQGFAIAVAIFEILTATGKPSIALVGHSMGGLAIREYLQRRIGGQPTWWVDQNDPVTGHRVSHVITYGTPHLGSNTSFAGLAGLAVDLSSEAVRDLRWEYLTSGQGRYLFGGTEGFSTFYHNTDVNADGDEADFIVGMSAGTRDNPQMSLPQSITYTWIVSNWAIVGDGAVAVERQWLYDASGNPEPRCCARAYLTDVIHTSQPDDYATLIHALGLDTGVSTEINDVPARFALYENYPNPFNPKTTISFDLRQRSEISLLVYDSMGRAVETLVKGILVPGHYRYVWNATGHPSGAYFYRLNAGAYSETRAMLLVR